MATITLSGALKAGPANFGSSLVQVPDPTIWANANREWGAGVNVLSEDKPVFILDNSFYQEGDGVLYGDQLIKSHLVRTGLTITGKGRKGEWTIDPTMTKEVTGIWPLIRGVPGTIVKIRFGGADSPNDPIRWSEERNFIVGTDTYVDMIASGRYIAVSFRSEGQEPWELLSYTLELEPVGS